MKKIMTFFGIVVLFLLIVGGYIVYQYGPNFNLYLFPPTVEKYVSIALSKMDQGYFANTPEWKTERARVLEKSKSFRSYKDALKDLDKASKIAGGKHSFIIKEDEKDETTTSNQPPVLHKEGDILYLKLTPILLAEEAFQNEYVNTLDSALAKKDYKGVIVDLSGNTGGDMNPMLSGLRRILPEGKLLSFKSVIGKTGDVSLKDGLINDRAFNFTSDYEEVQVPVAVITDNLTASSGEITALALMGASQVRSFGMPTAGYTSANNEYRLYDGSILQLTTQSLVDREGMEYFNDVIEPDVKTESAYEEALGWLREQ